MYRRIAAALLITTLAWPVAVLADASADGLGPASTTPASGGSSADSAALQPAGLSPLQSSNATGGQAAATDTGTLQQPATADNQQLQVLVNGDADDSTTSTPHASAWYIAWVVIGLVLIIAGILLWWRRPKPIPRFVDPTATTGAETLAEPTETPDDTAELMQNDESDPPPVVTMPQNSGDSSGKPKPRTPKAKKRKNKRHR